jgi:hypothetical protein
MILDIRTHPSTNLTTIIDDKRGTPLATFAKTIDARRVMARTIARQNCPTGIAAARAHIAAVATEMGLKLHEK